MTNEEFLKEVFRGAGEGETVFTCSVPGDPEHARYPFNWTGIRDPDHNNFFAVSTFGCDEKGVPRRKPGLFQALYCLVIDDVGTKVNDEHVRRVLGSPTWIVETSPGNEQWGYRLSEPVRDRAVAQGLVDALCREFIGDMAGVNRLVRLPVGVNGKAKYGDPSPSTSLVYQQFNRHSLGTTRAIDALGAERVEVSDDAGADALPADQDPILLELDRRGLLRGDDGGGGDGRGTVVYDIQCPWVSEHTGGRDDGAAYIAPTGFNCFHGHCENRTFADLRDFLGFTARDIDDALREGAIDAFGGDAGEGEEDDREAECAVGATASPVDEFAGTDVVGVGGGDEESAPPSGAPARAPLPWSVARYHDPSGRRVLSKPELGSKYPRQFLFDDLVVANTTWLLLGQGGLGKSRLALAIAMSAAAGLPVGPFHPTDPKGVRTMMVTLEDDNPEKGHRYTTQLRWFQANYPGWGGPDVVPRLGENLLLPEVDPTKGLTDEWLHALAEDQAVNGPYQFIIFDPLILFWTGEEEDGLNSATGARKTLVDMAKITRLPAKRAGLPHSTLLVHHLNKSGTGYGSIMVENLTRTVLKLERNEAAEAAGITNQSKLRVDKANGISKLGSEAAMFLETKDAVVHFKGGFGTMTREERVAEVIIKGWVETDCTRKTLLGRLGAALPMIGESQAERKALLEEVLVGWEKAETEKLSELGLRLEGEGEEVRVTPLGTDE